MPNYRKELQNGNVPNADPQTAQAPTLTNKFDTDIVEPLNGDPETSVKPSYQASANPSMSPELSQEFQDEMFAQMNLAPEMRDLPNEDKLRVAFLCKELGQSNPVEFYRETTAHHVDLSQLESAISNPANASSDIREFLKENGYDLDKHIAGADKDAEINKNGSSREEEEKNDDPVIVGSAIGAATEATTSADPKATIEPGTNTSPLETNPTATSQTANPSDFPHSLGTQSAREAGLRNFKTQRAELATSPAPTSSGKTPQNDSIVPS